MMLPPNLGLSPGCAQRRNVTIAFASVVLASALTSPPASAQNRYPTFGLPSSAYARPPVRQRESAQEATRASHETNSVAVADAERPDRRRDSNHPRAGQYERTSSEVDPRQPAERHAPQPFPQSPTRGDASQVSDSLVSRPRQIGARGDSEVVVGPLFPPPQSEDSQAAASQNRSSVRPAPTAQLQQSPPRYVAAVRPTDGRENTQKRSDGLPDRTSGGPAAPVCRPLVEPALFRPGTTAMRQISNEESGPMSQGLVEATHLLVSTSDDSTSAGSKRDGSDTPASQTSQASAPSDQNQLDLLEFFPSTPTVGSPAPAATRRASEEEPFDAASAPPPEDAWDFDELSFDDPAEATSHFGDASKTPAHSVPVSSQPVGPLTEPVLAPPAEEEPWPPIPGEEKWSAADPDSRARDLSESASGNDAVSIEIVPAVKGASANGTSTSNPVTQPATECPFLNSDFPKWMPRTAEPEPAAAPESRIDPTVHPRPSQPVSGGEPSAVRSVNKFSSAFATPPSPFGPSDSDPPSSSLTGRSRSEEIFKPPRLPEDGFGVRKDAPGDDGSQPTSQSSNRRMRTDASADFVHPDPELSAISESWPEPGPPYSGALYPFLPGQAFTVEERFVDPPESLDIDANALIGTTSEPSGADVPPPPEDGRPVPVLQGTQMQQVVSRDGTGLKGFCPVALRDERTLKDGRPAFASSYQGEIYYLASAEARAAFERNPAKYAPAAHGYDLALAAVTGELRKGSLDHAMWYRDRLYLFTSAESLKTFAAAPNAMAVVP